VSRRRETRGSPRWHIVAWLEVRAPEEPRGWRRVRGLGSWMDAAEVPSAAELSTLVDEIAARHDLGDCRWALDFNGGAGPV
jgi:hypothetical protein